ncbi:DUF72 domain-containing protein [Rhodanobacter glycinis]|uniref:DUF72 domain-containing protein n=1 Tax=Rhodanobacter glycinis TaxID=582702 RepID=UPI001128D4CB|nr:DUF72 domain-containing protein [Rhodanobacter glycinis]TPG50108.1 DUF72 domain-containing protein [Rhodanobacter glycinis]
MSTAPPDEPSADNQPGDRAVPMVYVGCAGWSISSTHAAAFAAGDSQLERYATVLNSVEINSSFYRPHRPATYRRWAASVPESFRFAVKMPRTISHLARLRDCQTLLETFLDEIGPLENKLGCLLLQLPPSLAWEPSIALPFLGLLRRLHAGPVACEPRHVTWFRPAMNRALREHGIARVAADPARLLRAAVPGGDQSLQYLRLHGSPRIYHDAYPDALLQRISHWLQRPSQCTTQRWCIFDNTALGHAVGNALTVRDRVRATQQN